MFVSFSVFITALILLFALFAWKRYELSGGPRLFRRVRVRADAEVVRIARVAEEVLPHKSRELGRETMHATAFFAGSLLLAGVRALERRLSAFTNMIKGRGVIKPGNGSASFYLKDIAEHKRQNSFNRDVS